jgi:ubiquinone/menaquinone biosynthesis C-methylase UbiE
VPEEVTQVLVTAAGRDETAESLLDIGTGDGQAVRALHPHFRDIIAIDPVKDLLDLAEQDLRPLLAPGTRLRLVQDVAERFSPPDGWTASLVTFCRAFHWVDRQLVLDRLAPIVSATGVVAIFHDRSFWRAAKPWEGSVNPWKEAVRAVILDFLGTNRDRPSAQSNPFKGITPGDFLAGSAFNDVEKIIVPVRRTWTSESILGFLYSTSFGARPLFGDRVTEFEREIKDVLAKHSATDTFEEDDEFTIWLGRKGQPSS